MSQAITGARLAPTRNATSPWNVAVLLSSVPIFISMLLPWWDDQRPLSLATHWPKVTLIAGVLLLVSGLFGLSRGVSRPWMTLVASVLLGVSLVAVYFRVDNSVWFAEAPFTVHVGIGFFYGLLGLGWAIVGCTGQFITKSPERGHEHDAQRRIWVGPLLSFAAAAVAVVGIYQWNSANVDRITLDEMEMIPPAVDDHRG